MNTFFKGVFEYHHHFNQQLIDQLEENQNKIKEKAFALFCHLVNSHQIWNARILDKNTMGVFNTHSYEECRQIDRNNLEDSLEVLNNYNLQDLIKYKNSQGEFYSNNIGDIYFHISNHHSHHKGQIISLIREAGIDPIITDYIFYKRAK